MYKKIKTNVQNHKLILILIVLSIFFSINTFAVNDTISPVIVYSSPQGHINTNEVLFNVVTDETSICNYDTIDIDFDSMSDSFPENSTNHGLTLSSLSEGTHTYYILCKDSSNNTMISSEIVTFTVDTLSPIIISVEPIDTINKDYTILKVITSEKTLCKFDVENLDYSSMRNTFEETDATLHTQELYDIGNGEYNYYVACIDYADNLAQSSTTFNVELPPTFNIDIEKRPPLKEGTYEVEVYSSKRLLNPPTFKYKFDDETKTYDISLVGDDNRWKGYMIIPEYPKNRVGKFIVSGVDYSGLTGTKITSGELFLVDTLNPNAPDSLNIQSDDEEVYIEWNYEGEEIDHYIIYRAMSSGVEYVDYYDDSDITSYTDDDVDTGTEYYYKICAVDNSGNKGDLSKEIRITVQGKKEAPAKIIKLSTSLELELNNTIDKLKSDLIDIDNVINKLEKKSKNEEVLIVQTFDLVKNSKSAREDFVNILNNLMSLRKIDLSEDEFESKIDTAKVSINDLKKEIVSDVKIVNSVEFQQVSSDMEINSIHEESTLRIDLTKDEFDNFSTSSKRLEIDAIIYSNIVSANINYLDGEKKEYTVFSKDIKVNEANNVWIVESIPDSITNDANSIKFFNKPQIFNNENPVVMWSHKTLKETNIKYYIEGIIGLDDANKVRSHLVYDPNIFVEKIDGVDNKLTANAISSKISFIKNINFRELFIPFMGVIIIAGLLVYYFVFLKEETLGEEHNLTLEEPQNSTSSVPLDNHQIMPKLNITGNTKTELDNYHYMINMIDHANTHADNINMEGAKKEYLLIYNMFKKIKFDNEHTKSSVKNSVVELYNKINLWSNINVILSNAHNLNKEELTKRTDSISMMLSVIHKGKNTLLTNYIQDYHEYLDKINNMTKNE